MLFPMSRLTLRGGHAGLGPAKNHLKKLVAGAWLISLSIVPSRARAQIQATEPLQPGAPPAADAPPPPAAPAPPAAPGDPALPALPPGTPQIDSAAEPSDPADTG